MRTIPRGAVGSGETEVRTDATSTQVIPVGTAFTLGSTVWSTPLATRDHKEVSIWFQPITIASVSQADIYVQWSDDGTTVPFDATSSTQQTDFLLTNGVDGLFQPKPYVARLTTASGGLVAGKAVLLSFPVKGGSFRVGVQGNAAGGTFGVKALRLA